MRHALDFITRDWQNKGLAFALAVIVFFVVDGKINTDHEAAFEVKFGRLETQDVQDNTLFLTLEPGYAANLDESTRARLHGGKVKIKFTGPRQTISDLKGRGSLVGYLAIKQTIPDEATNEQVWDIDESRIVFVDLEPGKLQQKIPDLRIRVLRMETRYVTGMVDLDWFRVKPGYKLGDAKLEKEAVKVTCPRKYFQFDTVRLRPVAAREDPSGPLRGLTGEVNRRTFEVVRPDGVLPAAVEFVAEPAMQEVTIPLVPVDDKLEIEARIVLRMPTDGSLGPTIPTTSRRRETFTFIGPPRLLKRCKELEGTDDEIQAVIDLSRLTNDRIDELKRDGIQVKPTFVYPFEQVRNQVQCEQPKSIWVSTAK